MSTVLLVERNILYLCMLNYIARLRYIPRTAIGTTVTATDSHPRTKIGD